MKLILVIIMLSGCATTQQDKPVEQNTELSEQSVELLEKYHDVQDQLYRHNYLMSINTCFINHNKCLIQTSEKKQCWARHEKCVINTYRIHKAVKAKSKIRRDLGE